MKKKSSSPFEVFAATLPIPEPLGYHVVVRPKPPKEKRGSLYLAQRSKNAEMAVKTIGQLVAVGELAWKGTDGLDFKEDSVSRSMKVGDWVVYRQHSGQKLRLRPDGDATPLSEDDTPDSFLLVMDDTNILARLTEEQAEQFTDWL